MWTIPVRLTYYRLWLIGLCCILLGVSPLAADASSCSHHSVNAVHSVTVSPSPEHRSIPKKLSSRKQKWKRRLARLTNRRKGVGRLFQFLTILMGVGLGVLAVIIAGNITYGILGGGLASILLGFWLLIPLAAIGISLALLLTGVLFAVIVDWINKGEPVQKEQSEPAT